MVATAHYYNMNVTLTNSVVPLLAVVVGLILVFRNGTSYDRYYEGRKDFGSMMSNIRNLARLVWINATPPKQSEGSSGKASVAAVHTLKVHTLQLLVAYAVAVKHHLRGEEGPNYSDFAGLFPPGFAKYCTTDNEYGVVRRTGSPTGSYSATQTTARATTSGKASPTKARNGSEPGASTPLLADSSITIQVRNYMDNALPLPLIIVHEITRTLYKFRTIGCLEAIGPAGTNAMYQLAQGMVDQLTAMERIVNTPIPVSYSIHLKQCVTLYLFALPFTLVQDLQWRMIPVVTVVAFTLMGIEGIAQEIEMPFGQDKSDLPLDSYCNELREEIEYIIERLPEGYSDAGDSDE